MQTPIDLLFLLYIFPIGFFLLLALLCIVFYLSSKNPFPLRSPLKKGVPVVCHYPTGKLKTKFGEEGERYLRIGKFEYIRLPTFKGANPHPKLSSYMGARSIWDKLNKPAYFMDLRKSLAVTANQWATLSLAIGAKIEKKEEIKLWEGEFMKPDDILLASWKGYKPAITKSMQVEAYEVGRRETGFNFGKFAVPMAFFIGIILLIIVVYGLFIK